MIIYNCVELKVNIIAHLRINTARPRMILTG
jgi:hypothetical protein